MKGMPIQRVKGILSFINKYHLNIESVDIKHSVTNNLVTSITFKAGGREVTFTTFMPGFDRYESLYQLVMDYLKGNLNENQ